MEPAFPEVAAGTTQLPDATALDGELVVRDTAGRLAFERLGAVRAAREGGVRQSAGGAAGGIRSGSAGFDRSVSAASPSSRSTSAALRAPRRWGALDSVAAA
jgi:hypothetical protein